MGSRRARPIVAAAVAVALLGVGTITRPAVASAATDRLGAALPGLGTTYRRVGAATGTVEVALTLAGRDDAGATALAKAIADPSSPSYRQALTPAAYAARFGPEAARVDAARNWLETGGLTVTSTSASGSFIKASGPASAVATRFGVSLGTYLDGTRRFIASSGPASVPSALQVVGLTGLETFHRLQPRAFPVGFDATPQDLWTLYDQPADNRGAGQKLAFFGWGATDLIEGDLRIFEDRNGLPHMPFNVVHVGNVGTEDGYAEWSMDAEASSGMAPDALGLTGYFAETGAVTEGLDAIYAWADQPDGAKQGSASYGLCEGIPAVTYDSIDVPYDAALRQAVLEGRSLFASSGDNGAGCTLAGAGANGVTLGPIPTLEYPAASPWAISVGGTVLSRTGTGATEKRDVEYAWTHGGGGFSPVVEAPDYQLAIATVASHPCVFDGEGNPRTDGHACRGGPDVAALSGDILTSSYHVIVKGQDSYGAGTSLSAPLMQGLWARINAAAPLVNGVAPGWGFANPQFYRVGTGPSAATAFYDVTVGANGYPATAGWDAATGLGVPDVAGFIGALGTTTAPKDPTGANASTAMPAAAVLPACALPEITDARGDTVDLVGSPADTPGLDLLGAALKWDPATSVLTGTFTLAGDPTAIGSDAAGTRFLLHFKRDKDDLQLLATHYSAQVDYGDPTQSSTSDTYKYLLASGTGDFPTEDAVPAGAAPITGAFDAATNTVTVQVPASTLVALHGGTLDSTTVLTGLTASTRNDDNIVSYGGDDAAPATPCQVALGDTAPAATPQHAVKRHKH